MFQRGAAALKQKEPAVFLVAVRQTAGRVMRKTLVDARKICGDPKFRAKRPRPKLVKYAFEAWQKRLDTYAGQILRRIGLARRTDKAA